MLVFDEDIGAALGKACEQDSDSDAVHLTRAAQIVRQHIFSSNPFTRSFEENCQEKSVPHQLLALVRMVLEGPSIKDQIGECSTPASLSIAQMMKYNCVKHRRKQADTRASVRQLSTRNTSSNIHWANAARANSQERAGGQDVQSWPKHLL